MSMSRIKIFSVYHRPSKLYCNSCIEPIQVGCANGGVDLGICRDDTGDNISEKNGGYCELTAQYWVWRNYLPSHPELEYVGFCHYRRFMDFWKKKEPAEPSFFNYIYMEDGVFESTVFNRYTEKNIIAAIPQGTDIVLPEAYYDERELATILNLYKVSYGGVGVEECIEVIKEYYANMTTDFLAAIKNRSAYHCLTFLMRREVFIRYAKWMFSFLSKVEQLIQVKSYYTPTGRLEGYLGELFFNMWLAHEIRTNSITVVECGGIMLGRSPLKNENRNPWHRIQAIKERGAWIKAELWARKKCKCMIER